jgi:hypothetical protein
VANRRLPMWEESLPKWGRERKASKSNQFSNARTLQKCHIFIESYLGMLRPHKKCWASCRPREHGKRGEHLCPTFCRPTSRRRTFFMWP